MKALGHKEKEIMDLFAAKMRKEGFDRFEEALEEFRVRFNDAFLKAP